MGGAAASWLVRSSTDRTIRVRALAGDILLRSWARHFTLTVPLSPSSINGYRRFVGGNLTNCWGVTCDGLASRPGGVEILLAASCYGNRDKLRPDEPVGSIRLTFFCNNLLMSICVARCYFVALSSQTRTLLHAPLIICCAAFQVKQIRCIVISVYDRSMQ